MEATNRRRRLSDETRQAVWKRSGLIAWAVVRGILLCGICFVVLFPLFSKVSRSFMAPEDLYNLTVRYIPAHATLQNYRLMWVWMDMPKTLFVTLGISLLVGVCQTAAATWVGYGFARFRFRGRGLLFAGMIVCMVIPPDLMLMPLYLLFQGAHLIDTPWPFVLMGLTCTGLKNGLYVFLLRQYFMGMPGALEEAAYVDGAGPMRAFLTVMLPGAVPMMVTVFLFSCVWQWLDSLYSSVFFQEVRTMTSALTGLGHVNDMSGLGVSDPAAITLIKYAGIVLLILPMVILYLFCQRFFVESIERSGLVG